MAGVIRKEPLLMHLFLPQHEHSYAVASLNPSLGMKTPVKNPLFDNAKIDSRIRRISLLEDTSSDSASADGTAIENGDTDAQSTHSTRVSERSTIDYSNINCDCNENDTFILFDTILRYFDSAVSDENKTKSWDFY